MAALVLGSRAASASTVVVLRIDGSIQPGSVRYLQRGLAEATRRHADLVLLELDTPGGALVSLREMTAAIATATPPVAAYVAPPGARAASAGFFLLLAADFAAMAPGSNTGAAHPVEIGPGASGGGKESVAVEKAVSDAAALARALASQRGRPVDLAEEVVRHSRSFTADEAREARLIDAVASTRTELLSDLNGRTLRRFDGRLERVSLVAPALEVVRPSAGERLLMTIADPTVAYLLLMLGIGAVAIELLHPGFVLPGVVGAMALVLALYALSILSVNFAGVALIVVGLAFLVAEAFLTSYGLLAVAGVACLVLGSVMLFGGRGEGWRLSLGVVIPAALAVGVIVVVLASRAVRAQRAPSRTGVDALVGREGEVMVPLAPAGTVLVQGEYWDARAATPLPRGTRVRVVAAEGRRLTVETAEKVREARP